MSKEKMSLEELHAIGDMDMFLSRVKGFITNKVYNKEFLGMDKEDVIQEILIGAYKSLDRYDSSKASLSTYIYIVIDFKIKELIRKVCTDKNINFYNSANLVDDLLSSESIDDNIESDLAIVGTIDNGYENADFLMDFSNNMGLDDREKKIFYLRSSGYDFVEIANILDLTKGRVSQLWKGIVAKYENL